MDYSCYAFVFGLQDFFHSSRNIAYSTCRSSQIQMLKVSEFSIKALLFLFIMKTQNRLLFVI